MNLDLPKGLKKARFIQYWGHLRSSYWFLPAVMTILAIVLSFVSIQLDRYFRIDLSQSAGWIWSGGPEGARGLLSTVAGSMITVVSLTFSITILAFAQASSLFGPRLLRNLMKDTGNQVVLGTFTATFAYCLLILLTISSDSGTEFTPHISVTLAIVLALISVGVLIYFIHHVALSIQAPYLVANVAADLLKAIDRLPEKCQDQGREGQPLSVDIFTAYQNGQLGKISLSNENNGYLQGIDDEKLLQLATQHNLVLLLPYRPGHFAGGNRTLVYVWPNQEPDQQVKKAIESSFLFGPIRTYYQDLEFGIEQLVEVAVRSLSAAINDPFTVMTCIDWLSVALKKLTEKEIASNSIMRDDSGNVRVVKMNPVTLEGAVEVAFNQIRQNARGNVAVIIHLLEAIAHIMETAKQQSERDALFQQARMIMNVSKAEVPEEKDWQDIRAEFLRIQELYSSSSRIV